MQKSQIPAWKKPHFPRCTLSVKCWGFHDLGFTSTLHCSKRWQQQERSKQLLVCVPRLLFLLYPSFSQLPEILRNCPNFLERFSVPRSDDQPIKPRDLCITTLHFHPARFPPPRRISQELLLTHKARISGLRPGLHPPLSGCRSLSPARIPRK